MTLTMPLTSIDGAVAKPSANRLVGTGCASLYRLQPTAGFKPLRPFPLSRTKHLTTTNKTYEHSSLVDSPDSKGQRV